MDARTSWAQTEEAESSVDMTDFWPTKVKRSRQKKWKMIKMVS